MRLLPDLILRFSAYWTMAVEQAQTPRAASTERYWIYAGGNQILLHIRAYFLPIWLVKPLQHELKAERNCLDNHAGSIQADKLLGSSSSSAPRHFPTHPLPGSH